MLPIYKRLNESKVLLRVSFAKLAVAAVSLPLGAFFFCVVWSILFEFVRSTFTHCDVPNYLPSVSAAIGTYEPQKTVWRLAIYLHLPLRLVVVKMYLEYYRENIRRNRRMLGIIACAFNVVENLALFCLSVWSSSDNYTVHRNSFIVFIGCSEFYMMISYLLNRNARKAILVPHEEKSLRYKRNLFATNVLAFTLAALVYQRHNSHCESGMYTAFAFFEYIVVLTNMGYHMTAYWDFYAVSVVVDGKNGIHLAHS